MTFLNENKPPLDEVLKHHGIKGMHWGHHKREEPSSGRRSGNSSSKKTVEKAKKAALQNETTKKYMAIKPKQRSQKEAARELKKNEQKFSNKFDPSVDEAGAATPKKGLSAKQKKLIKIGVGVAVVGGLVAYAAYSHNKNLNAIRDAAGKVIDVDQFNKHVEHSKFKTWGLSGYIQDSSHAREEFTLPAGHTFHRISTTAESTFSSAKPGTYSTHNIEDYNRYIAGFRHEKASSDFHHVTWTAKEPIKVPNLTTVLETLREHLSSEQGTEVSHEHALTTYQEWSGGGWELNTQKNFLKSLVGKGYGAIVDEMDAGVIGETPLVFIAPHLASEKSSTPITNQDITDAESSLIEITNRKI